MVGGNAPRGQWSRHRVNPPIDRAEAKVVRAGGRLVWTEADVLADGEPAGKFAATGIRVAFDPQAYIAERGGSDRTAP